jgi:hypothetical protein
MRHTSHLMHTRQRAKKYHRPVVIVSHCARPPVNHLSPTGHATGPMLATRLALHRFTHSINPLPITHLVARLQTQAATSSACLERDHGPSGVPDDECASPPKEQRQSSGPDAEPCTTGAGSILAVERVLGPRLLRLKRACKHRPATPWAHTLFCLAPCSRHTCCSRRDVRSLEPTALQTLAMLPPCPSVCPSIGLPSAHALCHRRSPDRPQSAALPKGLKHDIEQCFFKLHSSYRYCVICRGVLGHRPQYSGFSVQGASHASRQRR